MRYVPYLIMIFLFLPFSNSVWAQQEPADEVVEEEGMEDAAAGGMGANHYENSEFGFGLLYATSVGATDQTEANQNAGFTPKLFGRLGMKSWALEAEFALYTFNTKAKANEGELSGNKIAESDLVFVGQTMSILVRMGGETLDYFLGYGTNSFDASQSMSATTNELAEELDISFEQTVKPKAGSQFIVGIALPIIDQVDLSLEYRSVSVPVEVTTRVREISTGDDTKEVKQLELSFPFFIMGASYTF